MYVGLAINYLELQEKDANITEKYIEIDSLKETIDIQQQEIQKLKEEGKVYGFGRWGAKRYKKVKWSS